MTHLPDLGDFVRGDPAASPETVVLRGGPDTADKLTSHGERLRRAYVFKGNPVFGISTFAAVDEVGPASLNGLLAGRLATYRWIHLTTAARLIAADFNLLATFQRPHLTVTLDKERVSQLLEILGPQNPIQAMLRSGTRGEDRIDEVRRHRR
jgi:hypothetical protein